MRPAVASVPPRRLSLPAGLQKCLLVMAVIAMPLVPAGFAQAADGALTDTSAFDYAEGMSFYAFDGCGDAVAGKTLRRALAEKFAHCPFSAAARLGFRQHAQAQQSKSRAALASMINEHGGLPVQLPGMTKTCRMQMDSPEYQRLGTALEQYSSGRLSVEAVLPASCDAASMMP